MLTWALKVFYENAILFAIHLRLIDGVMREIEEHLVAIIITDNISAYKMAINNNTEKVKHV